ncbi:MAG: ABC transporter ATP-binding protein [Deltaproteobacteria bacterium]|nr:ABC transporter ATP-binding protein [Deltaproteobacteria bacterium]
MKKYLELSKVSKSYGSSVIVDSFDAALAPGEFVSVIGHSGCGKSTVLSMIAGLTQQTSGVIILAGREVQGPGPDRGVVFQAPCLLDWLSAVENVRLGVDQVMPKEPRARRQAIALEYLELVGLGQAANKRPAELSLGMRQRVGLARAFALSPRMLLLDEPFGMLDSLTRFELQEVLVKLWTEDQKTALMVTHDVDEALFLSDRIIMMTSGPAATIGEILEVPFERPRRRAALIESPEYDALRERMLAFLEGQAHPRTTEAA